MSLTEIRVHNAVHLDVYPYKLCRFSLILYFVTNESMTCWIFLLCCKKCLNRPFCKFKTQFDKKFCEKQGKRTFYKLLATFPFLFYYWLGFWISGSFFVGHFCRAKFVTKNIKLDNFNLTWKVLWTVLNTINATEKTKQHWFIGIIYILSDIFYVFFTTK